MVVLEVSWEALDAAIAKVLTLLALYYHTNTNSDAEGAA
jgi:hypothetical protein